MPDNQEESQGIYRKILDQGIDLVTMINDQGIVIYQASSVEAALGYTPEQVIGRSIFDFLHPADLEQAITAFDDLMAGKDRDRIVLRLRNHVNGWQYFEVVARPHEHEGRQTLVLNSRDVTDFRETTERLRRSERLLHAAFNTTNAICSISDLRTGEFIDVNDAWVRVFGYSRSEAIGRTAVELNIWGSKEKRQEFTDAIRKTGELRQYPVTTHYRDGRPLSLLVDAEILNVDQQERLFISCLDITEREQREAQLRQSQRMEAIAQLTGGIAHDLNNMLTVVLGQIDLALNRPLEPSGFVGTLQTIRKATSRGAELIRQLMIFSRKQILRPKVLAVDDTLRNMLPLLEGSLGGEITIHTDLFANRARSFVDESLLESALLNLCLNGRDAMPQGGNLWISSETVLLDAELAGELDLEPGEFVKVEVKDEGIGMDESALANAFEPYFTTKAVGQGTGLGLSMVFGFVTQSGGRIMLKSNPGEGTKAIMYLPTTQQTETGKDPDRQPISSLKARHVLLIEDNDELRSVLSMLLRSFGCSVTESAGGRFDIDQPVDVILSDIVLPGSVQGPALADAVLARFPAAKIIFMSGYPRERLAELDSIRERPLLRKPFSRDELKDALNQVLQTP